MNSGRFGSKAIFYERPYWKLGDSLNRQFILSVWRSRYIIYQICIVVMCLLHGVAFDRPSMAQTAFRIAFQQMCQLRQDSSRFFVSLQRQTQFWSSKIGMVCHGKRWVLPMGYKQLGQKISSGISLYQWLQWYQYCIDCLWLLHRLLTIAS